MKRFAITLSTVTILFFTACSDNSSSKDEGGDQVQEPVLNSGPDVEGERATDAVRDSANAGSDSTIQRNKDAQSTPH